MYFFDCDRNSQVSKMVKNPKKLISQNWSKDQNKLYRIILKKCRRIQILSIEIYNFELAICNL